MSRRRRKDDDHHDNHDRWLVSYADFLTLLFAFFVVMYALSTVNEGKYRILSDSLMSAFRNVDARPQADQAIMPPAVAPQSRRPIVERPLIIEIPRIVSKPVMVAEQVVSPARLRQAESVRDMAESIRRVLEPLTRSGQVNVSEGAHGITVEVNAGVLFGRGDATLSESMREPLRAISEVFASELFPVTVEGHTDDLPIATSRFPSNWELSSARAAAVVRLFEDAGVDPARLSAIGLAEQQPVADNLTPEGRARNRRVTIRLDAAYADPPPLPRTPSVIRPDDPLRALN